MIGFHSSNIERRALYDLSGNKIGYLDSENRVTREDGTVVLRIKRFKASGGLAQPQGGHRTTVEWWPRIADWKAR